MKLSRPMFLACFNEFVLAVCGDRGNEQAKLLLCLRRVAAFSDSQAHHMSRSRSQSLPLLLLCVTFLLLFSPPPPFSAMSVACAGAWRRLDHLLVRRLTTAQQEFEMTCGAKPVAPFHAIEHRRPIKPESSEDAVPGTNGQAYSTAGVPKLSGRWTPSLTPGNLMVEYCSGRWTWGNLPLIAFSVSATPQFRAETNLELALQYLVAFLVALCAEGCRLEHVVYHLSTRDYKRPGFRFEN